MLEAPLVEAVFADGFEVGLTRWQVQGDTMAVSGISSAGTYSARLRPSGQITADVFASRHASLHVEYSRVTTGMDANEGLVVEWSLDGMTWTQLERATNAVWARASFDLPASASNASSLRLRFRGLFNDATTERVFVDDVVVTGDDGLANPSCGTCGELNAECGTVLDPICNAMISCGTCDVGQACSSDNRCTAVTTEVIPPGEPRCNGTGGTAISTDGGDTFDLVCNGATGPTGPVGPQGPQGPQGPAPEGIELPPGDENCEYGGLAFADSAGGDMYICNVADPDVDVGESLDDVGNAVESILNTPVFHTPAPQLQGTTSTKITMAANGDIIFCDVGPRWVAPTATVVGYFDTTVAELVVHRYNSQGTKLWDVRPANGSASGAALVHVSCRDIDVLPNGNVVVVGTTAANASRAWLMDANGAPIHDRGYTGILFGARADRTNHVILGLRKGTASYLYKWTPTNTYAWTRGLGTLDAMQLAVASNDEIILASGSNNITVRVMRYKTDGLPQWTTVRNITHENQPLTVVGLALDGQDAITVATDGGAPGFMLARMNGQGTMAWQRYYQRDSDNELLMALEAAHGGTLYVGGHIQHPGQTPASEMFLYRLTSAGDLVSERREGAPLLGAIRSIALDTNGRVVVGGVVDAQTFVRMYLL